MPELDGFSLTFPVLGGELITNPEGLNVKSVLGTSFYIGNGFYLSAGHVIKEALGYGIAAIGVTKPLQPWIPFQILDYEINENLDIALFRTEHILKTAFPWDDINLGGLIDIKVTGYPHALNFQPPAIYRRDFKGYIITRRPYPRLANSPFIYELSIPCPKGMSGAFVLDDKKGKICGVVLGSDKSSLDLHYITEELIEHDGKIIYHKTETSTYGIAITSKELLDITFNILGGDLRVHLQNQNLIGKARR